jgi:LPPG:FO 2-phospho-L-lactate transferase
VIVIAPSNPIVSIGPILAVPGMSELLAAARARGARVVAVSGISGGKALKGPADRMLASLGHEATALGVARGYAGLIDAFVLDDVDAALAPAVEALGIRPVVTATIMTDDASRERLAATVLDAATA